MYVCMYTYNSIVSSFVICSSLFVLYSVFRSFERGGVSEHKLSMSSQLEHRFTLTASQPTA